MYNMALAILHSCAPGNDSEFWHGFYGSGRNINAQMWRVFTVYKSVQGRYGKVSVTVSMYHYLHHQETGIVVLWCSLNVFDVCIYSVYICIYDIRHAFTFKCQSLLLKVEMMTFCQREVVKEEKGGLVGTMSITSLLQKFIVFSFA